MPETTPLIKAALNLRVGAGFDVYLVSDITDEETKLAGILLEFILHDELLEFITRI